MKMSILYKRKKSPYYWWSTSFKGKLFRKSTKMRQQKLAKIIQSEWDMKLVIGDVSFLGIDNKYVPKNRSLDKMIKSFLNLRLRISDNAYNTARAVLTKLKQFLLEENITSIKDITLSVLNQFIDWLDCAAKTKKNYIGVISIFLDQAVKEGVIKSNQSRNVTLPKIKKQNLHRLLESEDLKIIFNNSGKWDVYYNFLYHTGLRAGDVAMLKMENIDLKGKAINSLIRKSRRIHKFPLSDKLIELIDTTMESGQPIFPLLYATSERKLNDNLAKPRKYMQRQLKNNGRKRATLHSFRTTYNNILRDMGVPIEDRQILLAHSSSETTKVYTHPNFKLAKKYINQIPKIGCD